MTSYFHNGAKKFLFEILSTLAHYNASEFHLHIKTGIYFILISITYQNIKTESFRSGETPLQSYIGFYRFFSIFFAFCDDVIR